MPPPPSPPSNPNDPDWPQPENPYGSTPTEPPSWQPSSDPHGSTPPTAEPPSWQPASNPYADQRPAPGWGQPHGQQPFGYGAPSPYASGQTDGTAVAALVVSLAAFMFACLYGFGLLMSPVAIFLGHSAKKNIDASQGRLQGRGLAQAGFIFGIIGTVLLLLVIAIIVGLIVLIANGAFDSSHHPTFDSGTEI